VTEQQEKWHRMESKYWSLTILNKYCTGATKYLMENEKMTRKVFGELTDLVAKDRAYEINDKQYTYVFESAMGGSTMVDLREVSNVSMNPPYYEEFYGN
jgi:hypothetical protein